MSEKADKKMLAALAQGKYDTALSILKRKDIEEQRELLRNTWIQDYLLYEEKGILILIQLDPAIIDNIPKYIKDLTIFESNLKNASFEVKQFYANRGWWTLYTNNGKIQGRTHEILRSIPPLVDACEGTEAIAFLIGKFAWLDFEFITKTCVE